MKGMAHLWGDILFSRVPWLCVGQSPGMLGAVCRAGLQQVESSEESLQGREGPESLAGDRRVSGLVPRVAANAMWLCSGLGVSQGQEICRGRASMTLSAQSNQARGSLALPGSLSGPPPVDCSPAWLLEPESLKISKQRTHYGTTNGRGFLASILPTKIVFLDLSGY